jgi:hypothetical protein
METKKSINPFLAIIAVIVGSALYKQIDFVNLTVEKPALSAVYAITFGVTVYFLIKNYNKGSEE